MNERPDTTRVLSSLKDFQRDTVEYVFRRLYLDPVPARRFLIADEVGLGKTLVARGLIAKTVDHLWDPNRRVDIIYICSNSDIARQNIQRLNITGRDEVAFSHRITLLPITVKSLAANRINFVSFTPNTSFRMGNALGVIEERALLYWMLQRAWNFAATAIGPRNVLQGMASPEGFRWWIDTFLSRFTIDDTIAGEFADALEQHEPKLQLRARFEQLAAQPRRNDQEYSWPERARLVGELRTLLAQTCLRALEPDLIILDEFQRFKELLNERADDGVSALAHQLFDYSNAHTEARVVLLSATPYKMYTMAHEQNEGEDHYQDFLRTLHFLSPSGTDQIEQLLGEYRRALFKLHQGELEQVVHIKNRLESMLRAVMVRTERLSSHMDANGMLTEIRSRSTRVTAGDLRAYLTVQEVAHVLRQPDMLEYWKSTPYMLNFMEDYQLKQRFRAEQAQHNTELASALAQNSHALLPWNEIVAYQQIDPNNARLRSLLADVVESNSWRLLWVPPALPYYRLEGPFAEPQLAQFTKRLIFSSWKMVPKVIATLISYEAERRMMLLLDSAAENTPEARNRRRPLLNFNRDREGRLSGMPVLGLLYPALVLAQEGDPLAATLGKRKRGTPTFDEIYGEIRIRLSNRLRPITQQYSSTGLEDQAWYWAAPILLDLNGSPMRTREWFSQANLAQIWSGTETGGRAGDDQILWQAHINEARKLLQPGSLQLGRPPEDLLDVLVLMALGAPGVVALRGLSRVAKVASPSLSGMDKNEHLQFRNQAAQVAWNFRTLYNMPEVIALLRGLTLRASNAETPYWRKVLIYNSIGGLQAVLDEYVHVLRDALGLIDTPLVESIGEIADAICAALSIRTVTLGLDQIEVSPDDNSVISTARRLRSHFALRFGDELSDDGSIANRKEQVRDAFNSPFWPFVLASTSVGQEGLDFHMYCHAIVHWNLPPNPVDLEQREGRIHRYKGHAVRKNVVEKYQLSAVSTIYGDPWHDLFENARKQRALHETDLIPYWIFPGSARIERHVPILPLSRDVDRFEALRRSLAIYRMVFGQNRQEDLLSFLLTHLTEDQVNTLMHDLYINLKPVH